MPDRGQVLTVFEKRIYASPTNRDILQYPEWIDVRGSYLAMAFELLEAKKAMRDALTEQGKLLGKIDELLELLPK